MGSKSKMQNAMNVKEFDDKYLIKLYHTYRNSLIDVGISWEAKFMNRTSMEKYLDNYERILRELYLRKLLK